MGRRRRVAWGADTGSEAEVMGRWRAGAPDYLARGAFGPGRDGATRHAPLIAWRVAMDAHPAAIASGRVDALQVRYVTPR